MYTLTQSIAIILTLIFYVVVNTNLNLCFSVTCKMFNKYTKNIIHELQ